MNIHQRFVSKLKLFQFIFLTTLGSSLISQNSYTFTNCGATGSVGPTPTQVINTYSSTNLAGQVGSAAGIQSWTVPVTGGYRILAVGAAGGKQLYSPGYAGGMGASVQGEFTLTAGTVLNILVGQKGEDTRVFTQDNAAPGGGGGTFVYTSSTASVPLMAAGGGGGGGRSPGLLHANITTSANPSSSGALGGVNGNGGQINTSGGSYWAGGGAGWLTNGTGGYNFTLYNYFSTSQGAMGGRTPANGGFGGIRYNDGSDEGGDGGFGGGGGGGSDNMGTGGGGGYSGGGGGSSGSGGNSTGGGGGSFNGGINQVNTPSVNIGHGYVVISQLSGVNIALTSSIACYGHTTAVLSATAVGGTGPYNYLWSPGGITTTTMGPVGAGFYTCTAIDANSTVFTGTIEVTQPALLSASVSQTSVTCNGGSNGSASVSVSGGVLPYSYTWSPSGGFSAGITGRTAGNYTVFVKDDNNCTTTESVTISQPPPVGVVGFAINPVVCAGQTTTLVAGGALTYTWTGGVVNGVSFTPSATTTYTVFGTTSSGCTGSGVTSVTVNPIPSVSIAGPSGNCPGSSVVLTASGASNYSWSTGGTSANVTVSPSVNTTYTVYGTGSNGCVNQTTKNLVVHTAPVITTTISSAQVCSGTPVILIAGGAATYTWSGGVTNGVAFYPTSNGTYTVIGTNANSCTNTATQALTIKPLPSISISGASISCAGTPVTLSASGGVTYTWSNSSNSSSVTASTGSSTVISVSGTGSNGCVKTAYHALFVNPLPSISINSSQTVVCDGMPLTLYGNGASTYTWLPGNSNAQFIVATPSVNTTYTLNGTSQNGCVNNNTILITVNNSPVISISGPSAVCAGNTLSLTASGASTYTWNTSATGAGLSLIPSATAIYSVAGTSANGCTGQASKTVYLDQTPTLSAFAGNSVVCSGMNTMLFANGASSYSWQPGGLTGPLVSVTPLQSTTYTVTGATTSGCTNTSTLEVIVNSAPVITAFGTTICATKSGIIQASGANTYSWSTAATGSAIIVSPAVNTVYTVTGYNSANCSASATVAVNVSPLPTITVAGPANVCAGGAAVLTANGAAAYQWTNGPATQSISVKPNATTVYSVTGTSQQNCSSSASFKVIVDPLPVITVSSSDTLICAGEPVTLNANGGSNYSWSGGGSGSQITASPTITTVFSVTGYGANGCANTASITQQVSECTGIPEQNLQTRFHVYPNPSNGAVSISSVLDLELVVINELGQVVMKLVLNDDNLHQVNLSSLAKGIYWIMTTSEGIRENRKLVVMD